MKKIILIGVGWRMRTNIDTLFMTRHDEALKFDFVAIVDVEPARMEFLKLLRRHLPEASPKEYDLDDLQRAFDECQPDFAFVASRNDLHCRHATTAMKNGCNLFCEKPLAVSIEDGMAILSAEREYRRTLMTGFVLRHAPLYQRMHDLVVKGDLGRIVSIEFNEHLDPAHSGYILSNWRRSEKMSGGHLLEKCCHDVDLLLW